MPYNYLHAACVVIALGVSACSTTDTGLNYTPKSGIVATNRPAIVAVNATDQRKEAPTRLATVMGGFGNPIKYLNTNRPVRDEVASAFTDGLKARGLYGGSGPYRIDLVIRKLDADMIIGRTARIDMDLIVATANGQTVYRDTVVDQQSDMKFFATGVFADVMDLQRMVQSLLNATVDRLLDKPEFRAAIGGRGARVS